MLVACADADLTSVVDPGRHRRRQDLDLEPVGQVLRHGESILSGFARDETYAHAGQAVLLQIGRQRTMVDRDVLVVSDDPEGLRVCVYDDVDVAGLGLHARRRRAKRIVVARKHRGARGCAVLGGRLRTFRTIWHVRRMSLVVVGSGSLGSAPLVDFIRALAAGDVPDPGLGISMTRGRHAV